MKIQGFIKDIRSTDKKVTKIMQNGIKFSFAFCLMATILLITYVLKGELLAYYIGMSLFKSSLFFIAGFIICGLAFNNILKEI